MDAKLQRFVLTDDNWIQPRWVDVDPDNNLHDAFMVNLLEDRPNLFDVYAEEWIRISMVSDRLDRSNREIEDPNEHWVMFTYDYRLVPVDTPNPDLITKED